jgi:hypothetical protein
VEADEPAKAIVSVSNTELPVTLHIWIRRIRASAHAYELAVVSSFRGRVGAQRRSIADNSLRTVFGNPSLLCDVARPWLGRELCMSLGAVAAVAQEVGYYGRGYLGDEVLQRGVARSEQVNTQGGHLMDNDDYPRYPTEIMVMGEWLNTLAHTIIQCQRHSH